MTGVEIRQADGERHDGVHRRRPSYLSHRRRSRGIDPPDAGQELAPASTAMVDRLLWRRRARPSATLDKMRTEL